MLIIETQQAEADEPGSVQYNYQVWRQQRNEGVITDTQAHAPLAGGWLRPESNTLLIEWGQNTADGTSLWRLYR